MLIYDKEYSANFGPLAATMQEKNPKAYADLSVARRRLSNWWLSCQDLGKQLQSQALEDQGEAYGIEEFLVTLAHIITVSAFTEVELADGIAWSDGAVS